MSCTSRVYTYIEACRVSLRKISGGGGKMVCSVLCSRNVYCSTSQFCSCRGMRSYILKAWIKDLCISHIVHCGVSTWHSKETKRRLPMELELPRHYRPHHQLALKNQKRAISFRLYIAQPPHSGIWQLFLCQGSRPNTFKICYNGCSHC